jgi:hypothetical protein
VRLDPLPGEAGVSAWRCRPVVAVLDVPPLPLFPVQSKPAGIEPPEGGDRLPEKEVVAVPGRADFPFPVEQGDLHALRGQAVLLEEWAQITLPWLAPMVDRHPPWLKHQQVQPAPPDDEADHPLRVGGVERHQALTGTFEDRMACVFQRPGHGVVNGPGFPGGCVQQPERPGMPPGEEKPWQEQRCGCGKGGLEKGSTGWERHDLTCGWVPRPGSGTKPPPRRSLAATASGPPCCWSAGWGVSSGEATPRPFLRSHLNYCRGRAGWQRPGP